MNTNDMQHGIEWWGHDVSGWLASEKFDGIRAYWNGAQLWTRGGNVIAAPQCFTDALPSGVHLDGELWAGRGQLQKARCAARYGGRHFTRAIKFATFDAPLALGAWPSRLAFAETFRNSVVAPVEFQPVENAAHLLAMFNAIKAAGGEGLIVRKPSLAYTAGRTNGLLKVKRRDQFRAAPLEKAA